MKPETEESRRADQPTGSKQGCRECGDLEFHTLKCSLNHPNSEKWSKARAYGVCSPVLPSERSAGDERKGLMICCIQTAEHYMDRCGVHVAEGTIIKCDKCGQEVESLGGRAWKAK